mmetsp:Transcript_26791/g.62961  ORF Transcript_26791/g.62961 Transcript_26791/m.62961 type:complete len:99 (+) Transcript_26791:583-879(+)
MRCFRTPSEVQNNYLWKVTGRTFRPTERASRDTTSGDPSHSSNGYTETTGQRDCWTSAKRRHGDSPTEFVPIRKPNRKQTTRGIDAGTCRGIREKPDS